MNLFDALDSFPSPWNWRFLMVTVAASVIATIAACMRSGSTSLVAGLAVLVVSVSVILAGRRFIAKESLASIASVRMILVPLLLGVPPMITAIVMGTPGAGGYPSVLVVLLSAALMITRDLEHRALVTAQGREDFPVHTVFHMTLAWVSTLFFFFGVAALWPWLGRLYDGRYFWILVLGVFSPTLYLWSRLRQPRQHHSMVALTRFNRLLPYVGIILLIAILVG